MNSSHQGQRPGPWWSFRQKNRLFCGRSLTQLSGSSVECGAGWGHSCDSTQLSPAGLEHARRLQSHGWCLC